ncbi:hypothetical protein BDA99DRAFT_530885, partial [Phascolomyces articulosus]
INHLSVNVGHIGSLERRFHSNKMKAEEEKKASTLSNVAHPVDDIYKVTSFNSNHNNTTYNIKAHNGQVTSCDCPDFQQHFFPYKHIFYIALYDPMVTVHPQAVTQYTWYETNINPSSLLLLQTIPSITTQKEQLLSKFKEVKSNFNHIDHRLARSLVSNTNEEEEF